MTSHEGWLDGLVLSPDGSTLAVADYHAQAIKLWNVASRRQIGILPIPTGGHVGLAISPDGTLIASGGDDKKVRLWDLNKRKELAVHVCDSTRPGVSISSDNRFLSTTTNGGLTVWSIVSGQEIQLINGDPQLVTMAVFSPQDELLATSSTDDKVNLWNINDGTKVISIPSKTPGKLTFSPDGRFIAVSTQDQSASIIDLDQRKTIGRLYGLSRDIMAFSPDSKTLVSGGDDGSVKLWNIATGQTALTLHHVGPVTGVSFSNDGTMMATSGADGTVKLWPAATIEEADGL